MPKLIFGAEFFIDAFWSVSTDRQRGAMGGVYMIPYTAISRYASDAGLEGENRLDFFEKIIRSMDNVYLADVKRKTPKNG
jgi:hypothetical protein